MRSALAGLGFAFLLVTGCFTTSDRQSVHIAVANDSAVPQEIRISIDGERVLDELVPVTIREPTIVSIAYLHLRRGQHSIEVWREGVVRDFTFDVRVGTRTNVRIGLKSGEITFNVVYGDILYI